MDGILLGLVKVNGHVYVHVGGTLDRLSTAGGWGSFLSFCPSPPFPLPVPSTMLGIHQVHFGRKKELEPQEGPLDTTWLSSVLQDAVQFFITAKKLEGRAYCYLVVF